MRRFRLHKENEIKAEGVEFTSHLYVINWLPDNFIDVFESLKPFFSIYDIHWIDKEED